MSLDPIVCVRPQLFRFSNLYFLLWLVVFNVGTAQALPEDQVYSKIVDILVHGKTCSDGDDFWKIRSIVTPLNLRTRPNSFFNSGLSVDEFDQGEYKLRFSQFGCALGTKGVMVIGPGRGESSPEYYETALDYISRGYSPVYVIDHRGQGLSPRLLPNRSKGHLVNFFHYINDFKMVVDEIVKEVKENPSYQDQAFFYTSNSMGGAVGLGYLQSFPEENPFTAVALLGPMIQVNYLSFVDKAPTFRNNLIYSESGVLLQTKNACTFGNCEDYANAEFFGDYVSAARVFEPNSEKAMTHSEARFNLKTYLWNDFDWRPIKRELYGEEENWFGPTLGGSTMSWALATTYFLQDMRSKGNIRKLPNVPILIVTGTADLRAYTPYSDGHTDLSAHVDFCDEVNEQNSHDNSTMCEFYPLADSFHEIYRESDLYRNEAIDKVLDFFEN